MNKNYYMAFALIWAALVVLFGWCSVIFWLEGDWLWLTISLLQMIYAGTRVLFNFYNYDAEGTYYL